MATPNVGILTNAGKNLIDRVNAGQAKIAFTKIVFSSMDNSQLTDDKIRALTTVTPQEVVVNNPEVTLDNSTGETRIRATGTNEKLDDGVYVKTYGVFAKDDTGNEILYGLTVSPNPNYFPAYDGVTPQVVTYSYKVIISNTSNITFTNSNDIYLSETDLGESLKPYAKIVYVNQQLDKVVHKTDTEEIGGQKTFDVAPIDKTTGNPYITKDGVPNVDLSGYVIDNKDNTIKANNVNYDLSKTGITPIGFYRSGSFNDLPLGTVLADANSMTDGPSNSHAFTTTTFSSSQWGGRKTQIAISDNVNLMYFRVEGYNGGSISWNSWVLLSDDSAVVHNTGTEEIAGQKTFDIAPIDQTTGHPYITKDGVPSLPPDIARTGQSQTFTAAQTFGSAPTVLDTSSSKGDNQVALMGDLKSLENSAWHQLDNEYAIPNMGYTLAPDTTILYKIDDSTHTLYLSGSIVLTERNINNTVTVTVQLGSIINSILTSSVLYLGYRDDNLYWDTAYARNSSTNLNFLLVCGLASMAATGGPDGKLAFVKYDNLV